MTNKLDLTQDPRFLPFVERYATDLVGFARDVCGIELAPDQVSAYEAAQRPDGRVVVSAHTGVCDDAHQVSILAPVALWHLFTRHNSTTIVVLPRGRSICRRQYRNLLVRVQQGQFGWLCAGLRVNGDRFYRSYMWQLVFRAVSAPEALCGHCADQLMWLVEAADQLDERFYHVIKGNCRRERNTIVLLADQFKSSGGAPAGAGGSWSIYPVERAATAQTLA